MTIEYIRSHINQLDENQIFTTREMLQYGTRGAVDQALRRLVNDDTIFRLAPGVFVRDASQNPSLEEIAEAKMTAWNKSLYTHAENLLIKMQIIPPRLGISTVLAVNSHSSSFQTIAGRVNLKGIGNRRAKLCKTAVGQIAYALWHLTKEVCTKEHVSIATKDLKRTEREEFRRATAMMPGWLIDLCRFRFPEPRVAI